MHRRPQFEPLARLAAAGCGLSGPWGPRWVGLSCRARLPGPLVLRWVRNPAGCCCGGFAAGARLGGCAPGFGPGALPSSRVGAYIRLGAAAAALPPGRVWVAVPLGLGRVLGLRLAWVRISGWVLLRRLCRRGAFGWLRRWVWAGCLAFVSRGCVCPAGCCCGGYAAGARLGGCAAGVWTGCLAFVSRGCVCPAGCCCGGFAAGARLGGGAAGNWAGCLGL